MNALLSNAHWDGQLRNKNAGVFSRCVSCSDIISNPVCSECLGKEMKCVLHEINPKLVDQIVTSNFAGDTNCITCGSEMGLCAHCFSLDVYEQIKDLDDRAAEEFLARFDFDLRVMFC